jgi:hypothetical protein
MTQNYATYSRWHIHDDASKPQVNATQTALSPSSVAFSYKMFIVQAY